MNMNGITVTVKMPRRRAYARLSPRQASRHGLGSSGGDYPCFVLATLQETNEDASLSPVFVCEFLNGCVGNVYTERVSFTDTDDEGNIIEEEE